MRNVTTSIVSGLAALMLLASSGLTATAATDSNTTFSFEIVDTAPISISAYSSSFAPITYDDFNPANWVTGGTLQFAVRDPRHDKGDWSVSVSTTGIKASSTDTPINGWLNLSLNSPSMPGIGTRYVSNLTADTDPQELFYAFGWLTEKQVTPWFWTLVSIPANTAPGTYSATVFVTVSSTRD